MAVAVYVVERLPVNASNVISTIGEISLDVENLNDYFSTGWCPHQPEFYFP
jgi:hypothetical protein